MSRTLRLKVLPNRRFDCIVRDEAGDITDRFRETYKSESVLMETIAALRKMTDSDDIKVIGESETL